MLGYKHFKFQQYKLWCKNHNKKASQYVNFKTFIELYGGCKLMARNGVHTGGRTKAEYYKVWDKETGIYKGVWRIGARQRKMPSLFRYERVSPEKEEEYNKLRQYNQMKKAIDKQNLERYDDYLK